MVPTETLHITGDSAFALNTYIMVPFRDTGNLSATQMTFNKKKLSGARAVIGNSFALLKGRFSRLEYIDDDERVHFII